jgi:hypothetical protein
MADELGNYILPGINPESFRDGVFIPHLWNS